MLKTILREHGLLQNYTNAIKCVGTKISYRLIHHLLLLPPLKTRIYTLGFGEILSKQCWVSKIIPIFAP